MEKKVFRMILPLKLSSGAVEVCWTQTERLMD